MATTFLNLILPVPTVTLGPAWASQINTAFEVIDAHDHSSGKGVRIPTAGLNINADLDFNENAALDLELANLIDRDSSPTGSAFATSVSVFDGDLYYTNASGVAVQLTTGGSIVAPPGNAQVFEFQNVTSDLVISSASDIVYLAVDTSIARTITLPLASSVSAGRIYVIKDRSGQANSNPITLAVTGSDLVDGQSSQTFNSDYGTWMIVGDGSASWYIS